ncbi:MAG: outer membrane protein assembly factor BamA [Lentisphaerae bacterium GWF2_49_21]|nr:MAG: outer membrane protein assembly factor BamA [Lentisphaerae bacterium GWF2_49_21]
MEFGDSKNMSFTVKTLCIIGAFLIFPFILMSADINDVKFEQKGYAYPEEMLKYNMQSKKGETFDQKILDDDIKRLFSTGNFLDVLAETSDTADGKVNIVMKIVSKPKVKAVTLKGNKKYTDEDLKDKITVKTNEALNDQELQKTLSGIRKYYIEKGYNSAIITHATEDAGEGFISLVINISENLRLKVNNVLFTGNTVYSTWKLKNNIATQHSYLSWLLNMGLYDKNEVEIDKERLKDLYWNEGYLDFKVMGVDVKEDANPEYVNITFNLEEGTPYKVSEVSVSGNKQFTNDELIPLITLKTDDIYDNRVEKKDIEAIGSMYYPLGYADFQCRPVRMPDFNTHTVSIDYRIIEGEKFTVRHVQISGNHNTKDKVIRRELAIQDGDPVDNNRIEASKSRLIGMDYFEKVNIVSVNTEEPGKKDVDINVQEKDTGKFSIGAGYSDSDNVSGIVELSQSNFDLLDPWNYFVGGGQRLKLHAEYGVDLSNFYLSFTEPWLFDIPLRLDMTGFYHTKTYEYWDERYMGGQFSLTKNFSMPWINVNDDFNSVKLGYTIEQVKVYHMDDDLSDIFQKEKGTSIVSKWSLTLARDTRNSLTNPTSGYLLSALGEINSKAFGGSENYYKVELVGSNYYSFINDWFVLHTGIKLGQVDTFSGGNLAPIYERYFLGGGDTVRGFSYRKISPVDSDNKAYGGESMVLGSVEVTHPIYEFIRGAVFCDIGQVKENAWNFSMDDFNIGAGYGLRIKLPYFNAPVKLDLAYPILNNQDGESSKLRFHFNLGFTWSP